MTKTPAIVLTAALALSLSACGDQEPTFTTAECIEVGQVYLEIYKGYPDDIAEGTEVTDLLRKDCTEAGNDTDRLLDILALVEED